VVAQQLADEFQDFENSLNSIETHLGEALHKYPQSLLIKDLETQWKNLLKKYTVDEEKSHVVEDRSVFDSTQFNLTPGTLDEVVKVCDKIDAKGKEKTPENQTKFFEIPLFDLGSADSKPQTIEEGVDNMGSKLTVTHNRSVADLPPAGKRPRRLTTVSACMCSPYVQRVVQMGDPVMKIENDVCEVMFAGYGEIW